jgi:hypothetical protein
MQSPEVTWYTPLEAELQARLDDGWRVMKYVESEQSIYMWRPERRRAESGLLRHLVGKAHPRSVATIRLRIADDGQVLVEAVE